MAATLTSKGQVTIPKSVRNRLHLKAAQQHLTVSKYLAGLVKKGIGSGWPDGCFEEVFGQWEGESLQRPEQGAYEQREELE